MDAAAIFALIVKGLGVIEAVIAAGQSALPAIKVMIDLVTGAQNGTVTDQQLADTEAVLDQMIADFNLPL
jgi:hypothetical protein